MTCVICKVELKEERIERWTEPIGMPYGLDDIPSVKTFQPTGYLYCPSCGLVYKEIK